VLAITTYATQEYFYCWVPFLRRIAAAARHHNEAHFILATDTSKAAKDALEQARVELPEGWRISAINLKFEAIEREKYKVESQLLIARLQGAAFSLARRIRATAAWSVEADVLVPADALRVSEWALSMPQADGTPYYDIAAATYPNSAFLGGFGTPQTPINEDFLIHERKTPSRLKKAVEACETRLRQCKDERIRKKETERITRLNKRVKQCPPDGNIWEITAKHGWRRRGWLDFAYPAIGAGAIVPTDWCGLGCTLLSGKALALATFEGYDGRGTQDLFLCYQRWHPANLRIAAITHTPCDHVKRRDGKIVHFRAFHETHPDYKGHLRTIEQEYTHVS
jgi:hypothetical protein